MRKQQEADEASKRLLQQQIDEKMEVQRKREERQAALKAKIDRQNKEKEEKDRVDRLIREQRQLEKSNAAIIAMAEAKMPKSSK